MIIGVAAVFAVSAWFLSGAAPDSAYRILPGYFPDPVSKWQAHPFPVAEVTQARLDSVVINQRQQRQKEATTEVHKQILFGDTHVHTTNSTDAFMFSLPLMHGAEGAFPPGYACDYARFVSQLDFYFLTDHAESYEPERWRDAIESIRLCNQQSDAKEPDLMAFMGWEWTQVGSTADQHYGHHNVLFKGYEEGEIPIRPIGAKTDKISLANRNPDSKLPMALQLLMPRHRSYLTAYNHQIDKMALVPHCEEGIPSPQLPRDCYESTATPGELYRKLDEWGIDTIVIPHGSTWGWYTPPNASWEHQLSAENMDPEKSMMIELYSGHGNSENYRDFALRKFDDNGKPYCPEPQKNYLPACWQAGEIIRKRCVAEGHSATECDQRAIEARRNFVALDTNYGNLTVPGATTDEWLDAGQARDIFMPSLNYRPGKSVQAGLALRKFTEDGDVLGFKWGLVGSTDTHSARPGHGFKQTGRIHVSDANGPRNPFWEELQLPEAQAPQARSVSPALINPVAAGLRGREFERVSSFLNLGGLAAVHAEGRSRDALWNAMKRREVYATSGHRILLWFNLLNATDEGKSLPMGSDVSYNKTPRFQVKAVGSFKQLPGCPDYVKAKLAENRLEKMSHGECYNPSDTRYRIDRIEVVRIRPQTFEGEPLKDLIEDRWKVIECPADRSGCTVEFDDPEYPAFGRDTVYYVRAIEEPIEMINGDNLRVTFDKNGDVSATNPCYGSYKLSPEQQCLNPQGQRAWSSPIFMNYKK